MHTRYPLIILITAVALLITPMMGCTPLRTPAAATPTATLLSAAASGGEGAGQAPTAQPSPISPTSPAAAEETASPEQPKEQPTDTSLSPAYDIYIGFNVGEVTCGWDNPGAFSRLAWVSAFHNVRFSAPPEGWSGEFPFESEIAEGEDESLSELADYAFCPTWEGDNTYECFVTEGPNPFEAHLDVYYPSPFTEDQEQRWMTMMPLVTEPLDEGPDLYVEYSIEYPAGVPAEERIILHAGDGHLGDCSVFGGPDMWLPRFIFPIAWQRLMKGEEFIKEFIGSAEDYAHWGENAGLKWTVHFVPAEMR